MTTLGALCRDIAELGEQDAGLAITGLSADSRSVEPGFLFAALSGVVVDGNDFFEAAKQNGAAAILTEKPEISAASGLAIVAAKDARLALAKMAARFHAPQPETMVAVTGTAGKTSVASFAQQLFAACGEQSAMVGTTGVIAPGRKEYGNLTTPDPVTLHRLLNELANDGVTHCAMEASSHGLDQKRLHGVELAAAGFTNLGRDHLDYHDTIETYLDAKLILFRELMEPGAPAVIFSDHPFSKPVITCATHAGLDVRTVGRAGDFLSLKRVEHTRYGQMVELTHSGKTYEIKYPLAGDFQVSNGLVAAGLVISSGMDAATVFRALENIHGASGRLELVGHSKAGAPVYVDYAHKPEALENVLNSLRPFATNKLKVVFGCGGDRDPGKRPIMGEIASRLADEVIVTDDNPRTEDAALVRSAIMDAVPDALEIADRGEAIDRSVASLESGDCLVIAGKGHETGQIVGKEVLEFSDHDRSRAALLANGGKLPDMATPARVAAGAGV